MSMKIIPVKKSLPMEPIQPRNEKMAPINARNGMPKMTAIATNTSARRIIIQRFMVEKNCSCSTPALPVGLSEDIV